MIEAAVHVPGVRLAVVAQQPRETLPTMLGSRLAAHWQVGDVTDPAALRVAVRGLSRQLGGLDRLFGAYEQLQVPLATVRSEFGLPGMRPEVAARFRDKALMKQTLREAGVPCARHQLVASAADALAFVQQVGFPVVAKPPAGAGARQTERLANAGALAAWLQANPPQPANPLLLEEFLHGREFSLESVSVAGEAVWQSVTQYDPTPLEVIEQPWVQWCVVLPREERAPQYADARGIGAQALRALGMDTGVSHCEWFRRADGSVAISEIAARPPGAQITTMISRAHNMDFVRGWVELQLFGRFHAPPRQFAVGTAYLRGQGRGLVRALEGVDLVAQAVGALVTDFQLPAVGQAPTGSYEGEGFIMVRHPETSVVIQALQRVISTLRVRLG